MTAGMAESDSIAHYRIGAKLGQGGMGEVYRATDTKLGRDVALKVIAPALANDPARLAGVSREAQVLASLNHPNIAAVYGIEDRAIVMELVEGPTLADRLKQGPIPLEEALAVARQIAAGLEAAHEKGIVHRDLKPGNVKITADGTIKLLDFGLAKHAALAAADDAMTIAPTASGVGLIVGTPAYMAPEQVRGKPVDKRVDVWAFGVLLYEMLTGAKLFEGENTADVMASVVTKEPDLSRVPPSVRPMLRRCLEKDPKRRLRDVADALLLLESTTETGPVAEVSQGARTRLWIAAALAALFAVAFAIVAFVHFRESPPSEPVVRFTTTLPENVNFTQNGFFTVSPDGRSLAFPAISADGVTRLWIHELDSLAPRPLMTEVPQGLDTLFCSPDSRFIAFTTFPPMRQLKRVDVSGGPAETITDLPVQVLGGTWDRGTILMGSFEGILKIPVEGGKPTLVTKVDASRKELSHYGAMLLPDGRQFLYMRGGAPGTRGVFIGSLDTKPEQQSATPLMMTDYGATFTRDPRSRSGAGWLLLVRDGTLLAQPFDPASRKLTGDPKALAEQVAVINGTAAGASYYSVSGAGTLAYKTGAGLIDARQLAWFDRQGKPIGSSSELTRYVMLKVSPDGTRAATMRNDLQTVGNADIWITDLARDSSIRLTFGQNRVNTQPVWSPDGKRIAWQAGTQGSSEFVIKAADGSGAEQAVYKFDNPAPLLTDWTSDGRFLVYSRAGDVFAMPIEGNESNRQPIPVVQTPATEFGAYVSPDSRWIAYISNESGRQEIYVQPFAPGWRAAGATPPGGKWLVSRGTLGLARWRADGKELLYVSADGKLMAVDVTLSPSFNAGMPRALFDLPRDFLAQTRTPGSIADVSRDHQRIFLLMPPPAARQGINVVLNWPTLLSRSAQ